MNKNRATIILTFLIFFLVNNLLPKKEPVKANMHANEMVSQYPYTEASFETR